MQPSDGGDGDGDVTPRQLWEPLTAVYTYVPEYYMFMYVCMYVYIPSVIPRYPSSNPVITDDTRSRQCFFFFFFTLLSALGAHVAWAWPNTPASLLSRV